MKRDIWSRSIPIAYAALMLSIPLSTSLSGCGGGTKGTGGYEVTGTMHDKSGKGIAGVTITVEGSNGQPIAATATDNAGSFSVSDVSDERAYVRAERGGKLFGTVGIDLASVNQSAYLELRENPDAAGCVDSTLESDAGGQATTRVTVWGNMAPQDGITSFLDGQPSSLPVGTSAEDAKVTVELADPTVEFETDSLVTEVTKETASNYAALVVVRDATGTSRDLVLNFVRRSEHEFNARMYAWSSEVESPRSTTSRLVALGNGVELRFDQNGAQINPVGPFDNNEVLNIEWKGVSQESSIGLNLRNITGLAFPSMISCINIEQ